MPSLVAIQKKQVSIKNQNVVLMTHNVSNTCVGQTNENNPKVSFSAVSRSLCTTTTQSVF